MLRTKLGILGACVLLLAASTAAHSIVPLNAVQNGGFEDGEDVWQRAGHSLDHGGCHTVEIVSPGAADTDQAARMTNSEAACYLKQALEVEAALPVTVLDFSAKIESGLDERGQQAMSVLAEHHASGVGEITVRVGIGDGQIGLLVFCNTVEPLLCDPQDSRQFAPAPGDGEWHHYQILLVGAIGTGILLIDGIPTLTATGDPASVSTPNEIFVGDTAGHDHGVNVAPTIVWDEVYYGPAA